MASPRDSPSLRLLVTASRLRYCECLGYTAARLVHIQTRYVPRHRSPCRPDLPNTVSTSSGHALACPPPERYHLCASSPVCIYRSSTEHMWPSVCPPRSQYIYRFTLLQPAYRLYIIAPSFEIPPLRSALHPAVLQSSKLLVTIRPGSRVATLGSIYSMPSPTIGLLARRALSTSPTDRPVRRGRPAPWRGVRTQLVMWQASATLCLSLRSLAHQQIPKLLNPFNVQLHPK